MMLPITLKTIAYSENNNPDSGAEGNDVVQRHVLVVSLHNAGPDKVSPVGPNSARTII